jgi:hypothetical protein
MINTWSCRWFGSKLSSVMLTTVGDTFGALTTTLLKKLTGTYGKANVSLSIEFSIGCGLKID